MAEKRFRKLNIMKDIDIKNYDYRLPGEKIAKYPLEQRDRSQLLQYDEGNISDHQFFELPDLLPKKTALYFNNTRVLYARLPFRKSTGAKIEVFCLEPHEPRDYAENLSQKPTCQWKCLVGNLKKWKSGKLVLDGHEELGLKAEMIERTANYVLISFNWKADIAFADVLEKAGNVPIPPYLNRNSEDKDKTTYQTLYSRIDGSVAAPTAGLHFTPAVFDRLSTRKITRHEVTLHVGAGTFRPVDHDDVRQHEMHREFIHVGRDVIESLLDSDKQVYAVGTTTVRTLESLYWVGVQVFEQMPANEKSFTVKQWEPYGKENTISKEKALLKILEYLDLINSDYITARTQIIIVPGYRHRVVEGLLTNFHQPRSTLLLLLASFVGDDWKKMYKHALQNNYRFLSYGDSCLINHSLK